MSRMRRNKGIRGEREVIDMLQPVVNTVYAKMNMEPPLLQRNTLQSDRGGFDVVGLEWLAIEVKRQESKFQNAWWQQAVMQAKGKEVALFYRCSHAPWTVRKQTPGRAVIEMTQEESLLYFAARLERALKNERVLRAIRGG